jgi:hypothetical protein
LAAPIRGDDTVVERLSKVLPADVTAAFLSAKAALLSAIGEPNADSYIFWTFILFLVACPFYFWFVSDTKNKWQIIFLCMSFIVFAISIAYNEFAAFLASDMIEPILIGTAIVVPIF